MHFAMTLASDHVEEMAGNSNFQRKQQTFSGVKDCLNARLEVVVKVLFTMEVACPINGNGFGGKKQGLLN